MKMLPQVSIIVPAYNAEQYIGRCLDSLLAQTFTEIEIIVVNDGSTDTTHAICHDYATRDERVVLVDIPNGGVSNARNVGIEKASGEWLMFVDADDWIDINVVETLVALQKEAGLSIVVYSFDFEYVKSSNKVLVADQIIRVADILEKSEQVLNPDVLLCSPCNKLYLSTLIKGNKIRFDTTLKFAEDFVFNSCCFSFVDAIVSTSKVLYHYDCSVENSGVKKLYRNYNEFLSAMTESFDLLVRNQRCNHDKVLQFLAVTTSISS